MATYQLTNQQQVNFLGHKQCDFVTAFSKANDNVQGGIFNSCEQNKLFLAEAIRAILQRNRYVDDNDNWVSNTLVTNGTFTGKSTGWTEGVGWAYHADNEVATNASSKLQSADTWYKNRTYSVTYTITSYTAGTLTPYFGSKAGTTISANGTYTDVIDTADVTSTTPVFSFLGSSFSGTIDNVLIGEVYGTSTSECFTNAELDTLVDFLDRII